MSMRLDQSRGSHKVTHDSKVGLALIVNRGILSSEETYVVLRTKQKSPRAKSVPAWGRGNMDNMKLFLLPVKQPVSVSVP